MRSRTTTGRASPATRCRASDVGVRGRAGRQARDAGRPVRHRPAADRRQGSVRAAPPCARRRSACWSSATLPLDAATSCVDAGVRGVRRRRSPTPRRRARRLRLRAPARLPARAGLQRAAKSTRCWRCSPQRSADVAAAARSGARVRRAARGAGAGRGQQAHRQHPEEEPTARRRRRSTPRCCSEPAETALHAALRSVGAAGRRGASTRGDYAGSLQRAGRR